MSTGRIVVCSVVFLAFAAALPGCGGGGSQTSATGEAKIAPPLNPTKGNEAPVTEEFKNLDPAGKGGGQPK